MMRSKPFKTTIGKTVLVIAVEVLLATACTDTKKVVYFNGIQDTVLKTAITASEPIIQKNDLISITVSSLNPEASLIFNTPNNMSANQPANSLLSGYLVNEDGNIQFPVLGSIHVAGYNKKQLTSFLTQQLADKKLLIDPIVTIRFMNFKVTVLGEVAKPGLITVPNEKVTVLEALGLAGDLTIYAKRENLLLIRSRTMGRN